MDNATLIIGLVMISVGFAMLVVAVVGLVRWKLTQRSVDTVREQGSSGRA